MTLSMPSTLLRIGLTPSAKGDTVSVSDVVAQSSNQKYPTIARQIDLLGEAGLGLVEKQSDETDRRVRYVAISARGKLLLQELDFILAPSPKHKRGRTMVARKNAIGNRRH
jgi:DNA-binding MarR family transcriptional regulator